MTQSASEPLSAQYLEAPDRSRWLHVAFALWIAGLLYLARSETAIYEALVQEDRLVEWWTVFLFGAASVAFGVRAWTARRLGDAGMALFCFVAMGEEVSWGQRILGFTPSSTFLEKNVQQEANLHNLVEAFGQPKWTLIAVLVAYGIIAPLLARIPAVRRMTQRLGMTIPGPDLAIWFAIAIGVLVWYPVRLTGEWVEALVGALFLAAAPIRMRTVTSAAVVALLFAVGAERATAMQNSDPRLVACARTEVAAILDDVRGDSLSATVASGDRTHRRLYSLWRDEELDSAAATRFNAAVCESQRDLRTRRQYGVDPWGTAYWVRAWTDERGLHLLVYSFGPNRRRDDVADVGSGAAGDDIVASLPPI